MLHPHFSPDGKKLLWSEIISGRMVRVGHWAIKLADFSIENGQPRLSNIQTLRPGGLQLYETHGFSPDGRRILFSGIPEGQYYYDMEIYVLDVSSARLSRLTSNDEWDEHAHFTLDGRRVIWASSAGIPQRKTPGALRLDYWIMNDDGSAQRRLTRFNDPAAPECRPGGTVAADFDWGPDGRTAVAKLGAAGRGETTVLIRFEPELR